MPAFAELALDVVAALEGRVQAVDHLRHVASSVAWSARTWNPIKMRASRAGGQERRQGLCVVGWGRRIPPRGAPRAEAECVGANRNGLTKTSSGPSLFETYASQRPFGESAGEYSVRSGSAARGTGTVSTPGRIVRMSPSPGVRRPLQRAPRPRQWLFLPVGTDAPVDHRPRCGTGLPAPGCAGAGGWHGNRVVTCSRDKGDPID